MGTAFSVAKLGVQNNPFGGNVNKGEQLVSKLVLCSCTGPSASVQAGMVASPAGWLDTCVGAIILGRTGGTTCDVQLEVSPSSTYAPATTKLIAYRPSSGERLSSSVNLSGDSWRVLFFGA